MVRKPKFGRMLFALSIFGATLAPMAANAQADGPTQSDAEYEVWFLESMIDHHAQAIQLANLSPARTANPWVLEASASVVANRSAEIATMQGWLADWYGVSYAPDSTPPDAAWQLVNLSGPMYDQRFMWTLNNHNSQAISAASEAANRAWHWDLMSAANAIASEQSRENFQITQWSQTPATVYAQGGDVIYSMP